MAGRWARPAIGRYGGEEEGCPLPPGARQGDELGTVDGIGADHRQRPGERPDGGRQERDVEPAGPAHRDGRGAGAEGDAERRRRGGGADDQRVGTGVGHGHGVGVGVVDLAVAEGEGRGHGERGCRDDGRPAERDEGGRARGVVGDRDRGRLGPGRGRREAHVDDAARGRDDRRAGGARDGELAGHRRR